MLPKRSVKAKVTMLMPFDNVILRRVRASARGYRFSHENMGLRRSPLSLRQEIFAEASASSTSQQCRAFHSSACSL